MPVSEQLQLFDTAPYTVQPFKQQLLKWIGNKQRFAHEIIAYFPPRFGTYYEPFLGSGAVLGTLAPQRAVASDVLAPLIEIWQTLLYHPADLKAGYAMRWEQYQSDGVAAYERIKAAYNQNPNGADLLFLARSCYGGVVRFRKDGYMSTPCGVHRPIPPPNFSARVDVWQQRVRHTSFAVGDFRMAFEQAQTGDLIYCDPPYVDSQTILYGAQGFSLARLFEAIARCKQRGVYVALSLDGTKKTGQRILNLPLPDGLFETEAFVNCGRSMLRRFQMTGQTLETELVTDRLLLTY